MVRLPLTGHTLNLERVDAINRAIEQFATEVSVAPVRAG